MQVSKQGLAPSRENCVQYQHFSRLWIWSRNWEPLFEKNDFAAGYRGSMLRTSLLFYMYCYTWWLFLTAHFRQKPNLMLCGFEKCGTTTLAGFLCMHKSISPPVLASIKEETKYPCIWHLLPFSFFGFAYGYRAHGPLRVWGYKYVMDACQMPTMFPGPLVNLTRVGAKFIFMLRDPVERAISAFTMHHSNDDFNQICDAYLSLDSTLCIHGRNIRQRKQILRKDFFFYEKVMKQGFIENGNYHVMLSTLLNKHPGENIFVSHLNLLRRNPQALFDAICQFLDIPPVQISFAGLNRFRGSKKCIATNEIIERLRLFYEESDRKTKVLLNRVRCHPIDLATCMDFKSMMK